jgi:hypothetical protein
MSNTLLDSVNPQIDQLLSDIVHSDVVDMSTGIRRIVWEKVTTSEQLEFLVHNNIVHPEVIGLNQYNWTLFGTIQYGPVKYRLDTDRSESSRESVLRQLMSRIRVLLNIRGKDFKWVGCTEYGYENRPHSHFLISLPNTYLDKPNLIEVIQANFTQLGINLGEKTLGSLVIIPTIQSTGSIAYICKEEYRRTFKRFYYSTCFVSRK